MTETTPLRRGWTTGACATAATKAALMGLWGEGVPELVSLVLPRGETPTFEVVNVQKGDGWVEVGVIKDAGDDPDVTHGAEVRARVELSKGGVVFARGSGVGVVTKEGLPIGVGEPAINPVPRRMMEEEVVALATLFDQAPNVTITVSVVNGEDLALQTWNPRLGIQDGLSILGTTGVVRPFSCAAWIASIHRGIDVARADALPHVAGCTGATSEQVVQKLYGLPDHAMLDMGDFAGGLLKYLRKNPLPKLTIGGGIGKMVKLGQGAVDLHSKRSQVDLNRLSDWAGLDVSGCNTALGAYKLAGAPLAERVAKEARLATLDLLRGADIEVDVVIIDRAGHIIGRAS